MKQNDFSERLRRLTSKCDELKGIVKSIKKEKKEKNLTLKDIDQTIVDAETAIEILRSYLMVSTDEVKGLFERTITSGLQEIFGEEFEFKLEITQYKNRNSCEFLVKTNEHKSYKEITMTQGTCLKEIVSVLCRIILICLDHTLDKVLILDEPFSGGEKERTPIIAEFMKKVIDDFGLQVILITHDDQFEAYADKVIQL